MLDFSNQYSFSSTQCLAALLRALMTWARIQDLTDVDRSASVLSVRRSAAGLPKGLSPADVTTLRDSTDTTTLVAKRDYAVIVLLSRLGIRVGEATQLTLDDIDWHRCTLTVTGKNKRVLTLPIPVDAGDAVVDHLRHRVCQDGERHVFIRWPYPR